MRKQLLIITSVLFAIHIMGCSEVIPDSFEAKIKVNTDSIVFDSLGGDQVLIIQSNVAWIIEFNSDWCFPSVVSDSGDVTLTIKANPNLLDSVRSTKLKLVANKIESIEILVIQDGKAVVDIEDSSSVFSDMREIKSIELSKLMGIGWNLGNSLEAISINNGIYSGNETSWGNPKVSKRLIDSIKSAGFNAIRIPVSWSHQLADVYSYEIKQAWLVRVEEVVNYILSNEMYAIINIHWDGGWMNHPDLNYQDEINNKIEVLWSQIANHFIEYNDFLLFAGTNEVHVEDSWSNPSSINAQVQNSFNQTFVNAVRSSGDRNALRHLIVQGYNTNIDHTISSFKLPEDAIDNRLMVEVHFYDPYDFALMESGDFTTLWGKKFAEGNVSNWGQESWVNEAFGKMEAKFVDKGIPVILGEYGAILRSDIPTGLNEHIEARNYYLEYVTKIAIEKGIVPFYWDNGYTGNNSFGLFDRNTGKQIHRNAIQSIMKAKN